MALLVSFLIGAASSAVIFYIFGLMKREDVERERRSGEIPQIDTADDSKWGVGGNL